MLILFLVSNMYTNRKISCQIKFINIYKQNKFKEKHPTHLTVCWMQADRAEGKLIHLTMTKCEKIAIKTVIIRLLRKYDKSTE